MGMHFVNLVMRPVSTNGSVLDKNNVTIEQILSASTEQRVQQDSAVASSAGYPTIKDYLAAEETAGYRLGVVNQTFIVTYN